jgi:putative sugar O-methyltransferase
MNSLHLKKLFEKYKEASPLFRATSYWEAYESEIIEIVRNLEFSKIKSGKYPKLATFGFGDSTHNRKYKPWMRQLLYILSIKEKYVTPYNLKINDIQNMAFHYSDILGKNLNAISLKNIEVSTFGSPEGIFIVDGKPYTVSFLNYYVRYCFANKHISFNGKEVLVELGSGSGYQIECLKKLYPEMTFLCFDLPAQLFLCESYLKEALGEDIVVSSLETIDWQEINLSQGKIHFFGSWQFPLIKNHQFDIFWNAASFGEMEPNIVENYLSCVKGRASWIYLLQMRKGQKTKGKAHVKIPITLEAYQEMLSDQYLNVETQDAYSSISKIGGDYFEGIWKKV